jgi:hypothetical protein
MIETGILFSMIVGVILGGLNFTPKRIIVTSRVPSRSHPSLLGSGNQVLLENTNSLLGSSSRIDSALEIFYEGKICSCMTTIVFSAPMVLKKQSCISFLNVPSALTVGTQLGLGPVITSPGYVDPGKN